MRQLALGISFFFVIACAPAERPTRSTPPPPAQPVSTAPAPCPSANEPPVVTDVESVAKKIVALFNARDGSAIFGLFNADMGAAVPKAKTEAITLELQAQKGKIISTEREAGDKDPRSGTFTLKTERGAWRMVLALDDKGAVSGLRFTEPDPPPPEVAKSTIALAFPFKGQWRVDWGGPTKDLNQHVQAPAQRRAADLVIAGADGKTHRGDGKKNDDYYAYGREILAAADGVVSTVIDGVAENEIGSTNRYVLPGNVVILKHGDTLYSVYAHLQPGKIRVKTGAKIKRGQVLGFCGNSGNSSEPHLHFQLQDGPRLEKSWGVEAVFQNAKVTRAGKTDSIAEYTFLKGDLLGEPGV